MIENLLVLISPKSNKYAFIPAIINALRAISGGGSNVVAARVSFASGVPTLVANDSGVASVAMSTNTLQLTLEDAAATIVVVGFASQKDANYLFKWKVGTITAGVLSLTLSTWSQATPPGESAVIAANIPNGVVDIYVLTK